MQVKLYFLTFFNRILNKGYNYFLLKNNLVIRKGTVYINGRLYIRNNGTLILGDKVTINSSLDSNPIGGDTRTSFVVEKNAELILEDKVGFSNSSIFCTNRVHIEQNVFIGGSCKIWDTDFHSINYIDRIKTKEPNIKGAPINIKKGAFIGAGSIILKGVTIGEESIIGAGSVVTKNIPARQIWAGNPIKFIREIS